MIEASEQFLTSHST